MRQANGIVRSGLVAVGVQARRRRSQYGGLIAVEGAKWVLGGRIDRIRSVQQDEKMVSFLPTTKFGCLGEPMSRRSTSLHQQGVKYSM